MFEKIIENVRNTTPLIHNITNYVTVNDCANVLLACGGSPIMTDDELEVEEITSICNGLVINIGTMGHAIKSMFLAGKKANELNHPIVLDPVGAGASTLRTDTVMKLLKDIKFSVIRGNVSEIKTLALGSGTTKGVDADEGDAITEGNIESVVKLAKGLNKATGAVIVITGPIDIVCGNQKTYIVRNGHKAMSKITGSGCMLTAMIAAYCAANNAADMTDAAAAAVTMMGCAGEQAYEKTAAQDGGTASFRVNLIDSISKMDGTALNKMMKIEEFSKT